MKTSKQVPRPWVLRRRTTELFLVPSTGKILFYGSAVEALPFTASLGQIGFMLRFRTQREAETWRKRFDLRPEDVEIANLNSILEETPCSLCQRTRPEHSDHPCLVLQTDASKTREKDIADWARSVGIAAVTRKDSTLL